MTTQTRERNNTSRKTLNNLDMMMQTRLQMAYCMATKHPPHFLPTSGLYTKHTLPAVPRALVAQAVARFARLKFGGEDPITAPQAWAAT